MCFATLSMDSRGMTPAPATQGGPHWDVPPREAETSTVAVGSWGQARCKVSTPTA